jgi:hypothetical protein
VGAASAVTRGAWVCGGIVVAVIALAAKLELSSGRLPWGPSGSPGLWTGDAWGPENSQRLADPYTLTHVVHGAGLYGLLWVGAARQPVATRLVAAVVLESAWEILENSRPVIERYRTTTASQAYQGDSVLNSVGDILACVVGFLLAWRLPTRLTVIGALGIELLLALWIRDGLLLNILMLARPIQAVRVWQLGR